MSFDVSFHPVPVDLIEKRLFPFLLGEGDIDDLVAEALRIDRVRSRAASWAMGVLKLVQDIRAAKGKKAGKSKPPPWVKKFNPDLHVWGRPFFIVADRPDQVSRGIDAFLKAQPKDVDELARQMLGRLDPGLVEQVQPEPEERVVAEPVQILKLRRDMDHCREFITARLHGQKSDGKPVPNFPLVVLTFASHFRPGWLARGYVWPTHLFREMGLDVSPFFDMPSQLFLPLLEHVPEIANALNKTITENHMVGGYVPPEKVEDFRLFLEEHQQKIEESETPLDFEKILEAVLDAERQFMGFAEATEVYRVASGIMN